MLRIKIAADFGKLTQGLVKMQAGVPLAIARGLNEVGDKVRTRVQRGLKAQTGVKRYNSITSRVRTARAFTGQGDTTASVKGSGVGQGMVYAIIVEGRAIPIEEFPVVVTRAGVDAKTWGVDHLFKRSFRQKIEGGLRARLPAGARPGMPASVQRGGKTIHLKGRFPIRTLKGPNLAKELGEGAIPGLFYEAVGEFVGPAILKHLAKLVT